MMVRMKEPDNRTCEQCDKPLKKTQKRFCSKRCKTLTQWKDAAFRKVAKRNLRQYRTSGKGCASVW